MTRTMRVLSVCFFLWGAVAAAAAEAPAPPSFETYEKLRKQGERDFAKGRWADALASFERARDAAPCDEAYVNILRALHNLHRLDKTIATAEEAIVSRAARLGTLVDRGMLMFQDRELYAEIVATAAFSVWYCDSRAGSGAPGPARESAIEMCGGTEFVQALPRLLGQDVDAYILALVELYRHERADSGFHNPTVYGAARGVLRRRGDVEGAARFARLEMADAQVAALERKHGATPFLPSLEDLARSAPKWEAIAGVYEEQGFPDQAAESRSRVARIRELAEAEEARAGPAEAVVRRRAAQTAARADLAAPERPDLSSSPLASRPREALPKTAHPTPRRPLLGTRKSYRLVAGKIESRTVTAGPIELAFDLSIVDGQLVFRPTSFLPAGAVDHALVVGCAGPCKGSLFITATMVGQTLVLGTFEGDGPGSGVDVHLDFEPRVPGEGAAPPP